MSNNLHNELRKEFQLERLILFSDAVFAIAITLLVIEIKIPEIPHGEVTDNALLHKLAELIPKFIGFLVSFLLIGQYWIVHHRMFGYVINFSPKLLLATPAFSLKRRKALLKLNSTKVVKMSRFFPSVTQLASLPQPKNMKRASANSITIH